MYGCSNSGVLAHCLLCTMALFAFKQAAFLPKKTQQLRTAADAAVPRTTFAVHQCADDVAQCTERQVDLGGLFQPVTWQKQQRHVLTGH